MVRLNCHSAFKHYEMFHHSYGDVINIGSNNTTIFNMGTGFGGGSFWSGLGYGLGNGIGSIFGGLFGGGMGGFGNYGSYGMSPFGMGGFSPFGNMGTWWNSMSTGGGARSGKSADSDCTCHCKHDKASNDKSCNDPDLKKINGFRDAVQGIQDLDSPDKAKVKTKYDEIVKAKKDQDDTHKAENTAAYDNLLEDLQKIADKNGWGNLDKEAKVGIENPESTVKPSDSNKPGKSDGVNNADGAGAKDGNSDISKLTPEQISKLTAEQISKLTPEEAKMLLGKLGALNENGDGVNATTNLTKLLLAQQSGLPLSCGHNKSLTNIQGADAYLKGKISNVTLSGENITFEIETDNMKLKMKCKADSSSYQIDKTIEQKTQIYKDAKSGITYEIVKDEEYGIREGAPAANRK